MIVNKGDLVIVSDGQRTTSCIVLSEIFQVSYPEFKNYYYSFCIETGIYGVIYSDEIVSIACESFSPDFDFEDKMFSTDYSVYSDIYDQFSYFPVIWGNFPYSSNVSGSFNDD